MGNEWKNFLSTRRRDGSTRARRKSCEQILFRAGVHGLGAPYCDNNATGIFAGITRVTGKNEMVRAVFDSIAYQIYDLIHLTEKVSGEELRSLQVNGGPTRNAYLLGTIQSEHECRRARKIFEEVVDGRKKKHEQRLNFGED